MNDPSTPAAPRAGAVVALGAARPAGAAVILGVGAVSAADHGSARRSDRPCASRRARRSLPSPAANQVGTASDRSRRAAGTPIGPAHVLPARVRRSGAGRASASGGTTSERRPADAARAVRPGDEPVNFALALKMGADGAIEHYLAELYDPTSPNYRHFLTAAEFGARFGLPLERIQALEALGRRERLRGPRAATTSARRSACGAPAGPLTNVFGVHLGQYVDPATGVDVPRAARTRDTVPPAIADAVVGLSRARQPARSRPSAVARSSAVRVPLCPTTGLGPVDLAKAYDIVPHVRRGPPRRRPDDRDRLVRHVHAERHRHVRQGVRHRRPAGRSASPSAQPITAPGDGTVEVALDIEVVRGVAPHAQILNFEAQERQRRPGRHHRRDRPGRPGRHRDRQLGHVRRAGALRPGLSRARRPVARRRPRRPASASSSPAATTAPSTAGRTTRRDHRETVDFPSASPYTIAVGGTQLSVRTDGTYLVRGRLGGLSLDRRHRRRQQPHRGAARRGRWAPASTTSSRTASARARTSRRRRPIDSAYRIFVTEPGARRADWSHIDGTSAAAPFWAASMLLDPPARRAAGRRAASATSTRCSTRSPTGRNGAAIFHDVDPRREPHAPGDARLGLRDGPRLAGRDRARRRDRRRTCASATRAR